MLDGDIFMHVMQLRNLLLGDFDNVISAKFLKIIVRVLVLHDPKLAFPLTLPTQQCLHYHAALLFLIDFVIFIFS